MKKALTLAACLVSFSALAQSSVECKYFNQRYLPEYKKQHQEQMRCAPELQKLVSSDLKYPMTLGSYQLSQADVDKTLMDLLNVMNRSRDNGLEDLSFNRIIPRLNQLFPKIKYEYALDGWLTPAVGTKSKKSYQTMGQVFLHSSTNYNGNERGTRQFAVCMFNNEYGPEVYAELPNLGMRFQGGGISSRCAIQILDKNDKPTGPAVIQNSLAVTMVNEEPVAGCRARALKGIGPELNLDEAPHSLYSATPGLKMGLKQFVLNGGAEHENAEALRLARICLKN